MLKLLKLIGNNCFENNKEFSGTWMGNPLQMSTPEECRSACIAKPSCKFFSFRNGNECLLMKTKGNVNSNGGVISGARENCPDEVGSGTSLEVINMLTYIKSMK